MEDAGDDGEMPQLEGAEEDASRMEEVVKLLIMSLKCGCFLPNCMFSSGGLSFSNKIASTIV